MTNRVCFEVDDIDAVIRLEQTGRDNFTVIYGKQVDFGLSYGRAATILGQQIMHGLACVERLDNGNANRAHGPRSGQRWTVDFAKASEPLPGTNQATIATLRSALVDAATRMVWIVEAEHMYVPGRQKSIHGSEIGAKTRAAELVGIMWKDAGMSGEVTAENYEKRVKRLTTKTGRQPYCDVYPAEVEQ